MEVFSECGSIPRATFIIGTHIHAVSVSHLGENKRVSSLMLYDKPLRTVLSGFWKWTYLKLDGYSLILPKPCFFVCFFQKINFCPRKCFYLNYYFMYFEYRVWTVFWAKPFILNFEHIASFLLSIHFLKIAHRSEKEQHKFYNYGRGTALLFPKAAIFGQFSFVIYTIPWGQLSPRP